MINFSLPYQTSCPRFRDHGQISLLLSPLTIEGNGSSTGHVVKDPLFLNILGRGIVRVGSSPWDVSPWHKDYFELQTIKAQLTQEVVFVCVCFITSPFSSQRDSDGKTCFRKGTLGLPLLHIHLCTHKLSVVDRKDP